MRLSRKGKLKGDVYLAAVQYNLSGSHELRGMVDRKIFAAGRGGVSADEIERQLTKASKDATDILEYLDSMPGEIRPGGPGSIKLSRQGWSIVGSETLHAGW